MWNNYWGNRTRRNVPQHNYNEESSSEDEDQYDSPLVSPSRPPPTRAGSPVDLAVPTLADNVDEELNQVTQTLRNVGHSHTFRGTRPETRPDPEGVEAPQPAPPQEGLEPEVGEVEVVEGHVVGEAANDKDGAGDEDEDSLNGSNDTMPDVVDFDQEEKADGEKAQDLARSIKIDFEPNDVRFWFAQLEAEMTMASVNSQWLKKTILQRNLPNKQKEDVKSLLSLPKSAAGELLYFRIKNEIIRIYAPKPQESYKRALTRTMTGLPSQLGHQLVNDVCKKVDKFKDCCCASHVQALWTMQLPVSTRAHVSNMEFSKDTYKKIFESADQVFLSSKQVSVAAMSATSTSELDETLPAFHQQNQPVQTAAIQRGGGRGNRGGGRGGRGSAAGGQKPPKGQGSTTAESNGASKPSRGPRHASNPPEGCCSRHYRHGADAWYCLAPLTCPWVKKCSPRP